MLPRNQPHAEPLHSEGLTGDRPSYQKPTLQVYTEEALREMFPGVFVHADSGPIINP
jgi:hypothetical protein